jgi:addiction module HigA family antidote
MLPKFRPPTHPGEMLLKEFLKPIGISQKAFADHLGWTYARLNEIINKHRKVTAASALSFADALGTTPEFWLNLQQQYDLWHELKKHNQIQTLPQIAQSNTSIHL